MQTLRMNASSDTFRPTPCLPQMVDIVHRAVATYERQDDQNGEPPERTPFTFKVPVTLAGLQLHAEFKVGALFNCNTHAITACQGVSNDRRAVLRRISGDVGARLPAGQHGISSRTFSIYYLVQNPLFWEDGGRGHVEYIRDAIKCFGI